MFVINKIKFDADNRYDMYEQRISYYYYKDANTKRFHSNSLTDYIYNIFIRKHLSGVFYDTSISVCDVQKYIQNLYITYYNYYIKTVVNDNDDYIIYDEIIKTFVKNNSKLMIDTKWIYSQTKLDIPLDDFIINVFKRVYSLPVFVRFGDATTIHDIFIYLAKLLDFIIEREINTIIIKIALGNLK